MTEFNNKSCAFTIVAKNYIGLGEILGKTLKQYNSEIDFYIIVADEFDKIVNLPANVLIARNILKYTNEEWRDMSFKYNLTEFCTAIKPATFEYLLSKGYESVIYFDPDIYLFSPIDKILSLLKKYDFVITPHICGIHKKYNGDQPEWNINVNGIFNLGFCGVKNSNTANAIILWWKERLKDQCFCERTLGQFTDQKWMDWLPAFLNNDKIYVLRDLGMDLAPWNFFERKINKGNDGNFYVSFREEDSGENRKDPLVFVHYSGFNYNKLKQGIVEHKRLSFADYPDLKEAMDLYGDAIKENADIFDSFIEQSYSYATFDNGIKIDSFHRRLYHGLDENFRMRINPFSSEKNSYYSQLEQSKLIDFNSKEGSKHIQSINLDKRNRQLSWFYRLMYRLLGFNRYTQFVKSMRFYSLPEMHTFLITPSKIKSERI